MNETPKTRFSGFVLLVVLLLILAMGVFTVLSRMSAEDKLIRLGFSKLKQYSRQLSSKVDVLYITKTKGLFNLKNKKYCLFYSNGRWIMQYEYKDSTSMKCNSSDITDFITYEFLDRTLFDDYIIFTKQHVLHKSIRGEVFDSINGLQSLKTHLYLPASYNIFNLKKNKNLQDTIDNSGFVAKTIVNYEKYYQFVYPFKINQQTFYISGFLKNKNYLERKQHVEMWVLIFIGMLLLFTLFSFPFIKLFLLSKTERIQTSDLVLLCFSISGIACFMTLMLLNLNTLLHINRNTENQLLRLSKSIKSSFISELNQMYSTLKEYEKAKLNITNARTHILSDSLFYEKYDSTLCCAIMDYPYLKGLFSINKNWSANILTTWDKDTSSNVSYRDYYKKKDEWVLPGSRKERRFRLQSIYSNTSGEVSTVLAKPSETHSNMVYCISSQMNSIMNTVLPSGLEFRIIGQDGLVWFNNNQLKNTRENFLEECDFNDQIQEAIRNRVEITFTIKISLKNYKVHISPIGTLPIYLVTLCDTREQNEFLSHLNYVMFIFIILGIIFALVASAIFYYERIDKRNSNKNEDDKEPGLIWLLADYNKNKRYIIVVGLNLLLGLIIYVPVLLGRCTILHFLLILFSAYSVCFLYTYYLLKSVGTQTARASMIITYSLVILLCNIIYYICFPHFDWFIVLEIIAILIIARIAIFVVTNRPLSGSKYLLLIPGVRSLWTSKDPYSPYALFMCSWLVIGCILPTIYLFKIAGGEEVDLITRKNQLELATRIERKRIVIDSIYITHIYPDKNPDRYPFLDGLKADLKLKGNYVMNLCEVPVFENGKRYATPNYSPESNYIELNKYLRMMMQKEDFRSYQMLFGVGLDTAWYWTGGYLSRLKSDTLTFHYRAKQKDARGFYSDYRFRISSVLHNQKTSKLTSQVRSEVFFISIILLVLVFLYLLNRIIVKKLFFLERPKILNNTDDPEAIPKSLNLFLIDMLNTFRIKIKENSYHILDTDKITNQVDNKVYIILNPLPDSPAKWYHLINNLEKLTKVEKRQVILVSSFTPGQIGELIDEQIMAIKDQSTKDSLNAINQQLTYIFSHFLVSFLTDKKNGKQKQNLKNHDSGHDSELLIGNIEGALTGILQKVKTGEDVKADKDKLPWSGTDFYDLFGPQYHYLWKNCTTNEKFILSDLSADSLVNTKNSEDIKNLIGKGILDVEGKLCFVSEGFRKYVTQLAGSEEFMAMEQHSKRADRWNKYKNPIYLIFGAIVVFFFFTQHDLIAGINGAVISITGIIGTLMKVLSGKSPATDS